MKQILKHNITLTIAFFAMITSVGFILSEIIHLLK
jgi:hypothetical protein